MQLRQMLIDCDNDTLLIKAEPKGPVCHTGADTCWSERNHAEDFLFYLEEIINLRRNADPNNVIIYSFLQTIPFLCPKKATNKKF